MYGALMGKPDRKRPLGRPRRRWENKIKMDLSSGSCMWGHESSWLRIETGGGRL